MSGPGWAVHPLRVKGAQSRRRAVPRRMSSPTASLASRSASASMTQSPSPSGSARVCAPARCGSLRVQGDREAWRPCVAGHLDLVVLAPVGAQCLVPRDPVHDDLAGRVGEGGARLLRGIQAVDVVAGGQLDPAPHRLCGPWSPQCGRWRTRAGPARPRHRCGPWGSRGGSSDSLVEQAGVGLADRLAEPVDDLVQLAGAVRGGHGLPQGAIGVGG